MAIIRTFYIKCDFLVLSREDHGPASDDSSHCDGQYTYVVISSLLILADVVVLVAFNSRWLI